MSHCRLLAVVVASFIAQGASAADYSVAPSGDDSAAGSSGAPWRTLQHAADAARAGDTVNVAAGHYAGFNVTHGGTAGARLTFTAASGAVIDSALVIGTYRYGINVSVLEYLTIQGFTIVPPAGDPPWYAGIRLGGYPAQWMHGDIIRGNTVRLRQVAEGDATHDFDALPIVSSWQDGLLVQGNTVSGGWDSGIYVANSSRDYVVELNQVSDVGGNGIHNNGDLSNGDPGINYRAIIRRNVIHHVTYGSGGQAISCDGVQDSSIVDNLIYDVASKGISLFLVNSAEGSKRDVVAGNTVICGGAALRMVDDCTGNTVFDNVLCSTGSGSASIDMNSGDAVGLTCDRNVVKDRFYSDGSKLSLSEWRASGFDLNSLIATPDQLFVDAGAGDYRLSATSAAIDAGVASLASHAAPNSDLAGASRPAGVGFDIGAYEYWPATGGGSTTGTTTGASGTSTGSASTAGSGGTGASGAVGGGGTGGSSRCGLGSAFALLAVAALALRPRRQEPMSRRRRTIVR